MITLEQVFETQRLFQVKLYGEQFNTEDQEWLTAYIKEHSIHLNQEINEALYELPYFKPWKDYSKMTDEEKVVAMGKFKDEMVDALHFFINMCMAGGIGADTLLCGYFDKHSENIKRQEEGYTHDKSYR